MVKKGRKARQTSEDLARYLNRVSRLSGVPFVHEGRLSLVRGADLLTTNPETLAGVLLQDALSLSSLSSLFGGAAVERVDVGRLARWSKAFVVLERSVNLEDYIKEGFGALRRYRGVDVRALIKDGQVRYARLQALLAGLGAGLGAEGALGLCVHAPGAVERLELDWGRADLEPIARGGGEVDRRVAAFAAALLGEEGGVDGWLPPGSARALELVRASRAAEGRWRSLLVALLVVAGEDTCIEADPIDPIAQRMFERLLLLAPEDAQVPPFVSAAISAWRGVRRGHTRDYDLSVRRIVGLTRAARHHHRRDKDPLEPDVYELAGVFSAIGSSSGSTAVRGRRLARSVADYMRCEGAHAHGAVSQRHMAEIARETLPRGIVTTVRRIAARWSASLERPEALDHNIKQGLAAVLLSQLEHERIRVPRRGALADRLKAMRSVCRSWPGRESEPVLRAITARRSGVKGGWNALSHLPGALAARVIALSLEEAVGAMGSQVSASSVERYVEACVWIEREGAPVDPRAPWFVQLMASGARWSPVLASTWVRGQVARGALEDLTASFVATLTVLGRTNNPFAAELEAWATPRVEGEVPAFEEVMAFYGLSIKEVTEYIHYRRMIGEGETFSTPLLKGLRFDVARAREAKALEAKLEARADDPELKAKLEIRWFNCTDQRALRGARDALITRERNRLTRARARLRRESFVALLDTITKGLLEEVLGHAITVEVVSDRLRDALLLLQNDSVDKVIFHGFIRDALTGRPFAQAPLNQAWLGRARAGGVDVDAWLAGVEATVIVEGQEVHVTTERDPLHVLRMGTYFDTCLSLDGSNAASTLTNAMDVNKQVLYGRRADGVVVARKLIGATAGGALAGYHTYAVSPLDRGAFKAALDVELAAFAERCGLTLSGDATPEHIHTDSFWYDDGNEAWGDQEDTAIARASRSEGTWVRYHETGDRTLLAELIKGHHHPLDETAAAIWLETEPTLPVPDDGDDRGLASSALAAAAAFGDTSAISAQTPRVACRALLDGAAPTVADWGAATRAFERLDRTLEGEEYFSFHDMYPSMHLSGATVEEILALTGAIFRLNRHDCIDHDEMAALGTHHAARALRFATLADPDGRALGKALEGGDGRQRQLALEVLRERACPGAAPALRRALRAPIGHTLPTLALALGTQGEVIDVPRIERLLRDDPTSLTLAVALARAGDPDAARALWRPAGVEPHDVHLARELQSPRLARAEARACRRLIEESLTAETSRWAPLRAWLNRVTPMALPGLEPLALFAGYPEAEAALDVHKMQAAWRAQRRTIAALERAEDDLDEVLEAAHALKALSPPHLGHDPYAGRHLLRHLAAPRSVASFTTAFEAALLLQPSEYIGRKLALEAWLPAHRAFEPGALPRAFCLRAARVAISPTPVMTLMAGGDFATAMAWLDDVPAATLESEAAYWDALEPFASYVFEEQFWRYMFEGLRRRAPNIEVLARYLLRGQPPGVLFKFCEGAFGRMAPDDAARWWDALIPDLSPSVIDATLVFDTLKQSIATSPRMWLDRMCDDVYPKLTSDARERLIASLRELDRTHPQVPYVLDRLVETKSG